MENIPSYEVEASRLADGIRVTDLLVEAGMTPSKSEARRAIEQGGVHVNEVKVASVDASMTNADLKDGYIMLQRGKKSFCRIMLKD